MLHQSNVSLDYYALLQATKRLDFRETLPQIRIALLSDAATQHFVPLLRVLFHGLGFHAVLYEGPFDGIQLEAFNPDSGLYQFQPDVVVLLHSTQALRAAFSKRSGSAALFLEEKSQELLGVWDALRVHSKATILQSTFVTPVERFWGNLDRSLPESLLCVVAALNSRLAEQARSRSGVLINDVETLASWIGRKQWFDDRFWDLAKSFCALEHMPAVAQNIVDIAVATRGRSVKCVVLDLDNTLWGGIIGDDGLEGIQIDAHGAGEAFHRFQCFLKELLHRGILLAVGSKNDMSNAVLPFEKHPEMVLKREDIAVFSANWNDKAEGIRHIREVLNIGFDSMVFLDDNPFERNLVRGVLPQVIVPDLPEDPADYVRALAEWNLFETMSFSAEDTQRTELYRTEAARREAQAAYATADAFLESLDMRIEVARFDRFHLPRIAQLIQRSNQFNLTTHRYSEAECEAMMNSAACIPLYAKLRDRLGDHGLIGIVVLEPADGELRIRDWLMSCRVLARGVEQYLMNLVVEEARERRLGTIRGEYIRTAKNDMVKNFFQQFGFVRDGENSGGEQWVLATAAYHLRATFIAPAEESTAAV